MNDLERQSFNNMKEQIEVRDDIIDKLFLRLDNSERNNEKLSKIFMIGLVIGLLIVGLSISVPFCFFIKGYFWSDYHITSYSNSYNESTGNLTIDRGEK